MMQKSLSVNLLRFTLYAVILLLLLITLSIFNNSVKVAAASYNNYSNVLVFYGNVGIGESVPSDTTSPQTTITNPLNGSLVSGSVSYTASASDNVGVTRVEFYIDNSLVGISSSVSYSTNWNTITYSDALHNLFTKAFDAAGNVGISYSISVRVDNLVPSVSVTNPVDGSSISGVVNVTANASDDVGINKVEFYVDNSLLGISYSAPYSVFWNTASYASNSVHTVSAKAYDTVGNIGNSQTVTVTKADTNPPTTAVTNPIGGALVSGTVNIQASASDNVGVTRVEFYIDGNFLGTDSLAPYSNLWNTTIYPHNSQHSIISKAYDAANNTANSSAMLVTVLDITSPSVNITSPTNEGTVPKGSTVAINANASDISGISKVEFRVNGTLKCSDITSPYSCNWKVPSRKNVIYKLEAKAFDTAGNIATHTVTVTSR